MQEGWWRDEYLILFEESEIAAATDRYAISEFLPGYEVLGLRGWDDFIVRDSLGRTFSVPTVPAITRYLAPFILAIDRAPLDSDTRYKGKIKWYVKPIVLGGDPALGENVAWVSHDQHARLVRFWNDTYRKLTPNAG